MYQVLFSKGYYYSQAIKADSVEEAIRIANGGVAIPSLVPTEEVQLYKKVDGQTIGTDILYVRVTDLNTRKEYNFMEDLNYEA